MSYEHPRCDNRKQYIILNVLVYVVMNNEHAYHFARKRPIFGNCLKIALLLNNTLSCWSAEHLNQVKAFLLYTKCKHRIALFASTVPSAQNAIFWEIGQDMRPLPGGTKVSQFRHRLA